LRALYPGTFDPLHLGHLDIVERCARLFDEVLVTVLRNPAKTPLFTAEERVRLIEASTRHLPNVRVSSFDGLTVEYARREGIRLIVRGLRAVLDFDYEVQMALMNRHLAPEVETVMLLTASSYSHLSSSLVKEIARHRRDLDGLVPAPVAKALRERLGEAVPADPS
jgi:pantetheine-phosphate adenylyltransferase